MRLLVKHQNLPPLVKEFLTIRNSPHESHNSHKSHETHKFNNWDPRSGKLPAWTVIQIRFAFARSV